MSFCQARPPGEAIAGFHQAVARRGGPLPRFSLVAAAPLRHRWAFMGSWIRHFLQIEDDLEF